MCGLVWGPTKASQYMNKLCLMVVVGILETVQNFQAMEI
jgi:hypothetical protein